MFVRVFFCFLGFVDLQNFSHTSLISGTICLSDEPITPNLLVSGFVLFMISYFSNLVVLLLLYYFDFQLGLNSLFTPSAICLYFFQWKCLFAVNFFPISSFFLSNFFTILSSIISVFRFCSFHVAPFLFPINMIYSTHLICNIDKVVLHQWGATFLVSQVVCCIISVFF